MSRLTNSDFGLTSIFAWLIRLAALVAVFGTFHSLRTAYLTEPALVFDWAEHWEIIYSLQAALFALIAALLWELSSLLLSSRAEPFTKANAKRLQRMSWFSLSWQVLYIAVAFLWGGQTVNLIKIPGLNLTAVHGQTIPLSGLILVVALFALAEIFRRGAAMREDLEGTV